MSCRDLLALAGAELSSLIDHDLQVVLHGIVTVVLSEITGDLVRINDVKRRLAAVFQSMRVEVHFVVADAEAWYDANIAVAICACLQLLRVQLRSLDRRDDPLVRLELLSPFLFEFRSVAGSFADRFFVFVVNCFTAVTRECQTHQVHIQHGLLVLGGSSCVERRLRGGLGCGCRRNGIPLRVHVRIVD